MAPTRPTPTLLAQIAAYGAHDATRELPAQAVHHAKRAVIDWFSALYPGTRVSPATNLVAAHARELGVGRSSLPGFATTAFPALAAWINGAASHTVEFDDIFRDGVYHPGCPTIAAALAVAEDRGLSGARFLNAVVIGYEISTRIAVAVQPSHYRYFHTTGTVGSFGAAAAAAALLAPGDAAVMRHALATVGTFASGLQQAFRSDSMTKPLHAGHAANVGVLAALAAAHGVTGAQDILDDLGMLFPETPELSAPAAPTGLSDTERAVLEAIGLDETHIDTVAARSGLPIPKVASTLLALEMRKLVKQLPGSRFVRTN